MKKGLSAIRVTGVDRTLVSINNSRKSDGRIIEEGLLACAAILLEESQKLVPVDTSELKKSGIVVATGSGLTTQANVAYGGPDAPYAYIVHERIHVYHKPPTQARYLADAVPMARAAMRSVMQKQVAVMSRGPRK